RGEIIEECYALVEEKFALFRNYIFETDQKSLEALPLGYGAIYNHSKDYNADYIYIPEWNIIRFLAERKIEKGEEILISYGEEWFSDRKMIERFLFRYKLS